MSGVPNHEPATEARVHVLDEMGAQTECGDVWWFPRGEFHRTRSQAITFFCDLTGCHRRDVTCTQRWMLRCKDAPPEQEYQECNRFDDGAFPVWRLETP